MILTNNKNNESKNKHYKYIIFIFFYFNCISNNDKNFKIVCTTSIITDAVLKIVQNKAIITTIIKRGVDPHVYIATYSDIQSIKKADIVFYNGLYLEGKLNDLLSKNQISNKTYYAVSDCIDKKKLITNKDFKEISTDPHIWLDVKIWKQCIIYMCDIICSKDSKNKDFYRKNLEAYLKELDKLDDFIISEISKIPNSKRLLITSHDSFSYYARAYSIKVIPLQGISTIAECGLRDISNMTKTIIDNKIRSIFLEPSVPQAPMLAVIEGCKKKGYFVDIGGDLYADSLGALNSKAETYVSMLKENTEVIVQGLK